VAPALPVELYAPQKCNGVPESPLCGDVFDSNECASVNDVAGIVAAACPVMCGACVPAYTLGTKRGAVACPAGTVEVSTITECAAGLQWLNDHAGNQLLGTISIQDQTDMLDGKPCYLWTNKQTKKEKGRAYGEHGDKARYVCAGSATTCGNTLDGAAQVCTGGLAYDPAKADATDPADDATCCSLLPTCGALGCPFRIPGHRFTKGDKVMHDGTLKTITRDLAGDFGHGEETSLNDLLELNRHRVYRLDTGSQPLAADDSWCPSLDGDSEEERLAHVAYTETRQVCSGGLSYDPAKAGATSPADDSTCCRDDKGGDGDGKGDDGGK